MLAYNFRTFLKNSGKLLRTGKKFLNCRRFYLASECTSPKGADCREMVRVLNVAEKNDAAKSIAELMSNGRYRRREGNSKFNKIYEFDYRLFNQQCVMVMTSVSGHLLNLEFVGAYKKWHSCNPRSLFDAPVELICLETYKGIKTTLEREIRNCQYLVIWTDGDREGENIGFEVIQVCQEVKPNVKVYRARFSEITHQAVTRACSNLGPPDERQNNAVNVRRELDLRIGAAFTRFQTLRLQKVFPDVLSNQLISYGSCQFPTLGFVVQRYKQVQAFVPEPFWKLKVTHKKDDALTEFTWKRGRLFDHTACLVLYQLCLENPLAHVTDIRSRNKSKWRPHPLDTVEFEKMASRKLRINAKEAMNVAEKLYTKGFISYPRTETTIFPKELNLVPLVEMQCEDQNWGAFATRVLGDGPNPRQGRKSDNAHPPIHPIKYTNSLQGNEKVVYEFVVRHFLACVSKDAEGRETTVEITVNGEKFAASGLMILARNYLDVYPYEKWNAKIIAEYNMNETFQPTSVEMNEGETKPPELLTEADLIALMEKHGIGTDATHAEHIETIKSRLYVGLNEAGRFVPGELGMGLVEGYDMMGYEMSKPHLRSELEADLKRICEGLKNSTVVLKEQVSKYKEVFIQAVGQAEKIDTALSQYFQTTPQQVTEGNFDAQLPPSVMKCPKCGTGEIVLKTRRDGTGFFLSCMAYPQCNAVIWLHECVEDVSVSNEDCHLCKPALVKKLKFKFKKGALLPFYPDELEQCIGGCDMYFLDAVGIKPIKPHESSTQSSSSGYSSAISNSSRVVSSSQPPRSRSIAQRSMSLNNVFSSTQQSHVDNSFNQPASRGPLRQVNNQRSRDSGGGGGHGTSQDDVVCNCGKSAPLCTVRKEGANTGRQFYTCPDRICHFFLWYDSNPVSSSDTVNGSFHSSSSSRQSPASSTGTRTSSGIPNCKCSLPGRLLTVQKEGANKGRKFYGCSKPMGQGCNFFQWATDDVLPSVSNLSSANFHNSGPGSSRKRTASESGQSRRKCGICSEPGHTKRTCPQNR